MRDRPDGVTLIGIYHWLLAGFFALGLCVVPVSVFGDERSIIGIVFGLVFGLFFTIIAAIIAALVGWGLWNMRSWSRMAAIVLAILQLFAFPIGTVIGALIIWYLWQDPDALRAFGVERGVST
jgi:hypothetical protein